MEEKDIQFPTLSIVVPVYNRPDEIRELLKSLCEQTIKNFEIIVVDDGSTFKCDEHVHNFQSILDIKYFYKENSGPGLTRNFGNEKSKGNFTVFLDSDCILPPGYIEVIQDRLTKTYVDAFGGPDKAHEEFTITQKAINYSMTSFLTTGGIRGGALQANKFYPRSFNMGYSKCVFEKTKGFSDMRYGEDIDMSIRIEKEGFKTILIRDAYVYHKRRTNFRQFFQQVFHSGKARINLYQLHPHSLKFIHVIPALFLLYVIGMLILALWLSPLYTAPLLLYFLIILTDAAIKNKSLIIGLKSVMSSLIQLCGYGLGFLVEFWNKLILKKI